MRYVLTGATGYVGGRLLAHLLTQQDAHVVAPTRHPDRLAPLASQFRERLDVIPIAELGGVCRVLQHDDVVIHLASVNEVVSQADPVLAFRVNTIDSVALVQAAAAAGVARFIYFSTAHVYGSPLVGVIDEGTLPMPIHPYALTHFNTEGHVLAAHLKREFFGVVFRLSNVVGAPELRETDRWTLLANDLCRQAVSERRLVLKTAGYQERDFVPMASVLAAVDLVCQMPCRVAAGGVYHLGAGVSLRVRDLADRVVKAWQELKGDTLPLEIPAGSPVGHAPLTYRVERLLAAGFRPQGSLDEELRSTLERCLEWY